jgi:hypothetical protein
MAFLRSAGLGLLVLCCAGAVLGWNLWHFHNGLSKIREKDLSFLPAPILAELLCLGHRNTVAKLRWIDSFAYFEYQLDRHDDRVLGGGSRGGMERLYDTLIALDPRFESFYEHAALNTGGVLDQNRIALGFIASGLDVLPQSSQLWRNAAAILRVYFHWDEQLPLAFTSFLSEWRRAIPADSDQLTVWIFSVTKHIAEGAQQASYWIDQLRMTKPGTPVGDFVESRLRKEFARLGVSALETLVNAYRIAHGGKAARLIDLWMDSDLIDPFELAHPAVSAEPTRIEDLAVPLLVRPRRYPEYLIAVGPLTQVRGKLVVRSDPFGLPWRLDHGRVLSLGLERERYASTLAHANSELLALARKDGGWPATLAEARARGLSIAEPPEGGRLALDGQSLVVTWDPPPSPPWVLR